MAPTFFENFLVDALNSERKPYMKKNGRPGQPEAGRPAGQPA